MYFEIYLLNLSLLDVALLEPNISGFLNMKC